MAAAGIRSRGRSSNEFIYRGDDVGTVGDRTATLRAATALPLRRSIAAQAGQVGRCRNGRDRGRRLFADCANRRGGVRYRRAHASRLSGQCVRPVVVRRMNYCEASFYWLEAHVSIAQAIPSVAISKPIVTLECSVYLVTQGSQVL